jgi:hypothetical protein
MRNPIFIAGCARSGTTLLLNLMSCFENSFVVPKETHFDFFLGVDLPDGPIVAKRNKTTHETLPTLPAEIQLVYMVRHPLDTLTSYHPKFPAKKYYVSEQRWRQEYYALRSLRIDQPNRTIVYVRYCDLVTTPDAVQRFLAESLGLKISRLFSQSGRMIFGDSVNRYESSPSVGRYVRLFPFTLRKEIGEYCDEFGFRLPADYAKRPEHRTPIRDLVRRVAIWVLARRWLAIVTRVIWINIFWLVRRSIKRGRKRLLAVKKRLF